MELIDNLTLWWSEESSFGLYTNTWVSSTWVLSIIASCTVGLTGVIPLVIVPDIERKDVGESQVLRLLLSFAVGSLLGDVFLHLLPEAWHSLQKDNGCTSSHVHLGMFVLLGIFTFMVVEMMFTVSKEEEGKATQETYKPKVESLDANQNVPDEFWNKEKVFQNGVLTQRHKSPVQDIAHHELEPYKENNPKQIAGYLNLVANAIDNFSHGLAVAASFIVGPKMGILTTASILIHEIPHEVGDFAILLKSGFNRWEAAKAQFSTAAIGVTGALFALCTNSFENIGSSTQWILPFTAGGFLNIALVSILPDLMKERDPWESMKQVLAIFLGIAVMGAVGVLTE